MEIWFPKGPGFFFLDWTGKWWLWQTYRAKKSTNVECWQHFISCLLLLLLLCYYTQFQKSSPFPEYPRFCPYIFSIDNTLGTQEVWPTWQHFVLWSWYIHCLYTLSEFRIPHQVMTDRSERGLNADAQQEVARIPRTRCGMILVPGIHEMLPCLNSDNHTMPWPTSKATQRISHSILCNICKLLDIRSVKQLILNYSIQISLQFPSGTRNLACMFSALTARVYSQRSGEALCFETPNTLHKDLSWQFFIFYCLPGINASLAGRAIGAQRHLSRVQWNSCFHFLATFGGFTLGPCSCILLSLLVLCRKLSEESTCRGKLINTWCYQAACSVLSQAHAMYKYILFPVKVIIYVNMIFP